MRVVVVVLPVVVLDFAKLDLRVEFFERVEFVGVVVPVVVLDFERVEFVAVVAVCKLDLFAVAIFAVAKLAIRVERIRVEFVR